ncbi:MAG: hypothetical protein ORN83_16380 [Chthoniobacteraceae bacterium]|nr:hypothetical protein [Chthoniobacteraceae bacterium]
MNRRFSFGSLLVAVFLSPLVLLAVHEEPVWKVKPGPWGDLEVRTVYLEPQDTLLAAVAKPNSVTRWVFEQTTETAVRGVLLRCEVPAGVADRLLDPARRVATGNVISLYPSVDDLVALSPASRSALYAELAKSSANEYQRDPVYILGGDLTDWLMDAGLSDAQKDLFSKLVWKRGEALVFSDIQALLTLAKTSAEVLSTFRAVTRVRCLIVELQLPLKGDRNQFIEYWSAGQTDAPRLTFVNAITKRRAPQTVDITHFLPSLMRQRAYTFPEIELGLKGRFPDCHWTSLNFFNITPKEYYLDTRLAAAQLVENYTTVEAPYKYGDVLCFLEGGEGLHTCVYIADDIVLTKNGDGILAPWALMQIKDVDSIYRRSPTTRIQGFRLKR